MRLFSQFVLRPIRRLVNRLVSLPLRFACGLLLFLAVLVWLSDVSLPIESNRIKHQLVDSETGQPIINAVGVYQVQSYEGSFHGSGDVTNRVLHESRVDDQGMLDFAPQPIAQCFFGTCSYYRGARIYVFAPGYLPRVVVNPTETQERSLKKVLQWHSYDTLLRLERPTKSRQYLEKMYTFQEDVERIWQDASNPALQCDWARIPQMLSSIHMESLYRNGAAQESPSNDLTSAGLGRSLVSLRVRELFAGKSIRFKTPICQSVIEVLNATPIRCKDGSKMKDTRWEFVAAEKTMPDRFNVSGTCVEAPQLGSGSRALGLGQQNSSRGDYLASTRRAQFAKHIRFALT